MQNHELKRTPSQKRPKRVGRGGKRGTYSGRGGKGQTARAGGKVKPLIRELLKRYPKVRGYRAQIKKSVVRIVRLDALERAYEAQGRVTPETLHERGLIALAKGRVPAVKVLATGNIAKPLNVQGCLVSAKAKEIIEKAGGSVS